MVEGDFSFGKFFYLTNVSVQVILFPLNLVLRASLIFFGMESKKSDKNETKMILLILTLYDTFDILLQWWLLIRLKFFSNFSNRKTPSYSQNLISFNHFFSYNHLLLSSSLATWEESGPLSPGSQRVMI